MRILPAQVHGAVQAPPSKSMTIRALAAAALADGASTIKRPSRCLDALAAIDALEALGASFSTRQDSVIVEGGGTLRSTTLNCGESALCMRMLAPVAAARSSDEITLQGEGSLRHRPMGMIETTLRTLGASCSTDRGHAPVRVQGPLAGGRAHVDASATSQVLTGLLFALPLCSEDSDLETVGMVSAPYIDMTLEVIRAFGVSIEAESGGHRFRIPGCQRYRATDLGVEGDWSAAAFFLVAGAIAGEVEVGGLRLDSTQADTRVVGILRKAGARVELSDGVRVTAGPLKAFRCDLSDCPDLLPPLVVLACACEGTSEFAGVGRIRGKESDRVAALSDSLGGLGAEIEVSPGFMRVTGAPLQGGVVESHDDHRIAMALAVAALRASASVELNGSECVAKSHPQFFEDLKVLLP